ncbi:MAG: hypothetical protein ABIO49_12420 [Dokdonella sp.]
MKPEILLGSLIVAIAAVSVSAKNNYHEVINAETPDAFEQKAAMVHTEMEAGGRYEFVKPDERKTLDVKFTEMEELLKQNGSVQNMKQNQKVQLFNAQEVINAILTKRDSDRVICENFVPIGSHIPKTKCHTYGQAEEARRETVHTMNAWDHRGCVGGTKSGPCMPGLPGAPSGSP